VVPKRYQLQKVQLIVEHVPATDRKCILGALETLALHPELQMLYIRLFQDFSHPLKMRVRPDDLWENIGTVAHHHKWWHPP